VLLVLVAAWLMRTFGLLGLFGHLEPHFAGTCSAREGIAGPEDLTIHPRTGIAYISSCDRTAMARGGPANGTIYALALDDPAAPLRDLLPDAPPEFCPHGISLWVDPDGRDRLFAIHHEHGGHFVSSYDIQPDRLQEREVLRDPLLVSPNDLVAVGPDRFYATNDHGHPEGPLRLAEEWLRAPLSNVVRYDGERFAPAASGIRLANGIQASADGRSLYVAAALGREVRIYDRDPASDALALRERVPVRSVPDNLELDAEGAIWIGAHPRVFDLLQLRNGRASRAPSQVLRVARANGSWQVDEIYLELGDTLSAASVAAVRGQRLLVGAIFGDTLLDCRLP
jgi:arylesterase/paraoxonase